MIELVLSSSSMMMVFILFLVIAVIIVKRGDKKEKNDSSGTSSDTSSSSSSSSSSTDTGDWKTTGITFYGQSKADDNGLGYTGIDLFKWGKSGTKHNGKPVFPGAVFQGDGAKHLYKILEVQCDEFKKNKTVYVHIVDVCDSSQDVCKRNTKKHGFLVDIHATGFEYVGNDDGLLRGKYRIVGEIPASKIPSSAWRGGGSKLCSCTGDCRGKNATWKKSC
jgi:hypothetical protein